MTSLQLPPISTGLKSIAPYLGRAEELVEREPIVAYWCAYYAAQLGLSLKVQDTSSRNLLINLLDALERLKMEIGPDDAIDIEPASAAYVENFALRVFKMADDEDRAGTVSKSTAKKFLAAANFFEVLRVFSKTDVSQSVENKLKYAKWKAVDIARALREGRRPIPGPAGSELGPDLTSSSDQFPAEQPLPPSPKPILRESSPPKSSSRSPKRQSPPPPIPPEDMARANNISILPGEDNEDLSPGRWSTTATPGDLARTPGFGAADSSGGSSGSLNNWHEHVIDPLTRATAHSSSKLRNAWVSTEMEGTDSDAEPVEDSALNEHRGRGRVRFSLDTPAQSSPPKRASASPSFHGRSMSASPHRLADLPPGFVPTGVTSAPVSATIGSPRVTTSAFVVPPPPQVSHSLPTYTVPLPPVVPPAPPVPSYGARPMVETPPYPPPPPREVEITPKVISQAQRHCRFAISALDYEDTQHAIRELKAALAALGAS